MKLLLRSLHIVLLCLLPAFLPAQPDDPPHTELNWYTIETEHFFVHYHEGAARTGSKIAHIAESIYGRVTGMYRHQPDQKVHFVVRDHDDYSNGAAYFYDNKIEIWAPAMDFELRGIHPWLWNVVTHEFTHLIQIQTSMKLGRKIPAIYFQWFGYEAERRPDVLYGFPNVLVSYPLSAFVVPSWFAEGTAQYNHPDLHFDYWDSHRDMILRMYMIDGNPLEWEEMAVFGKTSLGNESAYNAGFSIVHYVAERYGPDTLRQISEALGSLQRLTIDGAIESVLGKTGTELYDEWRTSKEAHYQAVKERIGTNRVEGEIIEQEGFGNSYPQFSPDGSVVAYVSNKGFDYFGSSALYLYDMKSRTSSKLIDNVRSTVSFSPDGRYLYYSKATSDNPHWSKLYDIFRYDRESREEERLTHGRRALSPDVSPDGKKIVFVYGKDGTTNLGMCDSSGKEFVSVTNFVGGQQTYTPSWSPDGKAVAAGFSEGDKQSVILVDPAAGDVRMTVSDGDSRNPVFSRDGTLLYYSSDRTGIYNIYSFSLVNGEKKQVTNVLGGAFLPSVDKDGNLVYAAYASSGYKIAFLAQQDRPLVTLDGPSSETTTRAREESPGIDSSKYTPPENAREYRNKFTSLSLIPVIRVDNYNPRNSGLDIVKPGLYVSSTDMLDKLSLFGGAALNRKLERDLFVMLEYRDRLPFLYSVGIEPALSLELYNITRKATSSFTLDPSPELITTEITYNLFEVDIAARHRIFNEKTSLRLWYALSRYSADIGAFLNPNTSPPSLVSAFRNTYLIGNTFTAEIKHKNILPSVESEINPIGRSLTLRYAYESNKFNPEYEVQEGVLVPVYTNVLFHRFEGVWNEHLGSFIDGHTINLAMRGAGVLGKTVDNFFDFYAGGVLGMKGYPFYALGGNTVATAGLVYRFPLVRHINFRLLQFYFTKLYGSFFGDVGNAWTGSARSGGMWKKDAGFELRLEAFSFYAYPTRFFFSGSYGFDRFERTFNETRVTYGKEWRFYFGVLFGFELNDITHMRGMEERR